MIQQTAQIRYLHIAPRKVRLIADTLKGLPVSEAEAQLILRPQRAAKPLLKLIRSAVSNVKNNQKASAENLIVKAIRVDGGPMLKRSLPRAMGRATPIHKKMSHVTIVLEDSQLVKGGRFTIIPPVKKEKKESKRKKIERPKPAETRSEKPREKEGFLKRFFRRKAV